jgi:hypothetical protein
MSIWWGWGNIAISLIIGAQRHEMRPTGSNAKLSGSVLLGAHSWFVSPVLRWTLRGKLSVRSTN